MITLFQGFVCRMLRLSLGVLAIALLCNAVSPGAEGDRLGLGPTYESQVSLGTHDDAPLPGTDSWATDDIWGPNSCTDSNACYELDFSFGPWFYGGPEINFGYQTPDAGVTVNDGLTYFNNAEGYILDGNLIIPTGQPGLDTFIIGVEYWDAVDSGWTSRASTPIDNYFASLPIIPDPAAARLGSVFNEVTSASMRTSTNNVSIDLLGARHFQTVSFSGSKVVKWQLRAGVTMGLFENTTDMTILGNELGVALTETGRYEIESFRAGPVLGFVRSTDVCLPTLGIAGTLDIDVMGRLNIGTDRLYGIQRQNGPATGSLGIDRTLRSSVHETTFSPEFITGMTLWMPMHDRMTWSIGCDFHMLFGTPAVSFPDSADGSAFLEPTTDFTVDNEIYYGGSVKFGLQY